MDKALVLGGNGLLGQALRKVLAAEGMEVETLNRSDGDLGDNLFLKEKLIRANADIIFNTIAWTQVDDAEEHPEAAERVNCEFPERLAQIVSRLPRCHLVHYSTDFVFSGKPSTPWKETDLPAPQGVYARTKLDGERAVERILPDRSCILRTAWLFGAGKKNFVETILNLCAARDSIKVVDDQIGSPTYTMDLAQWSWELGQKRASGLWNAVNSGRASWCELAAEAIALASGPCRLVPISSAEWPQKAPRPSYSVLDNSRLAVFLGKKPRPWPQALRDYIFGDYLGRMGEKN